VPYSFQQRQRANTFGAKARLGTVPCHVSQSSVAVERSGGVGYSHAPHGELRPLEASMRQRSPMIPCASSSLAFAAIMPLTRCEPACTMRPDFCVAFTIAMPSAGECDIGFSQ